MKHLFLVVWSLLLSLHWVHSRADDRTNCKPVTTSFCQGVGYTTTLHPNGVQGFNLQQIGQIVATACSPHVATLMCRIVVPECTSEDDSRMKPCRALCEKVKTDCESTLRAKGLLWPIRLRCETLPEANCVQFRSAGGLEPVIADTGHEAPIISVGQTHSSACQPINIPACKDLHYTETVLPEDETQDNIALKINQLYPLVKVGCSSHLKPLLCSVFLPECVSGKPRSPCRTLCEKAKSGCEPLLNKFGFTWPEEFKCTAFTTESCEHYGVSSSGGICEPITIPMCQGLSYNETLVPNLLGHTSQREAFTKMSFFNSIVQTVCSVDIRIFLCRVYAPQCEAGQAQWPCRSFCEKARRDCGGLMSSFGVSWPDELQCSSFPEEMCISENNRPEMLNAEDVAAKLEASGYSVYGKSLTLSTARLLLTLMDKLSFGVREEKFGVLIEYLGARRADKSKDLDTVEFFKLEHFVAIIRREYVESCGSRNPPSVTEDQLKKAVAAREFHLDAETFKVLWHEYRSQGGIDYDKYVAVLTKLQILKDRFKAHLTNFPCDCQVASFSIKQFMKSAIV